MARELELFEAAPPDGKRVTVEVCVHQLYFDESDYERKGAFVKCNPAIKTRADRDALRRAVAEDRIDVIATDHAPHTLNEKLESSYFKTPAGLPLVQHALPMVLELVREGCLADLVLVDLDQRERVEREQVLYKCGWSPLEGMTLNSRIRKTFVNGELKYDEGRFLGGPNGRRLAFG